MKSVAIAAACLAALTFADVAAARPNPDAFQGVTRGRMHDVDTGIGAVGNFTGVECWTHFKLISGKGATSFHIDWANVMTVRLNTESSFENGVDAEVYKTEPGLVIEGNDQAVHFTTTDKHKYTANSFEFFTGSKAAAEAALAQLETVHKACAVLHE